MSADPRTRWARVGWWLLPPLVLALVGGWVVSRDHSLWYDELYTAEVAPLPLGDLVEAIARGEGTIPYLADAPPSYNGPYYIVAHGWLAVTRLPAGEVGLRALSLVAAVGAVGLLARAVGHLSGPVVGLLAGLVAATNPFVVQFAAEARGYGLAMLATTAACLGFARWLRGKRGGLVLYGLAGAAAGLAHWFALLVLAGLAMAAVVLRRRKALGLVGVTALAAVPAAALVGLAVSHGYGAAGVWWLSGVGARVPGLLLTSWSGGRDYLLVATVAAAVAGAAFVVRSRSTQDRETLVTGASWFAVPVAAVVVLELFRPVFVDRYLLPATLGVAVVVALGIARARPRWVSVAAGVAVLGASLWATVAETRLGPKEEVRGAVAAVARRHQAGEPVVAAARWDALGLDHYARRLHPALVPDVVLPPVSVPPAAERVWVVRRATGGVKGDRHKLAALDRELSATGLSLAEQLSFGGRYAATLVQRWERAPGGGGP